MIIKFIFGLFAMMLVIGINSNLAQYSKNGKNSAGIKRILFQKHSANISSIEYCGMKDFRKPQQTFYFIYLDHGHSRPHQSQPQHPQGVLEEEGR